MWAGGSNYTARSVKAPERITLTGHHVRLEPLEFVLDLMPGAESALIQHHPHRRGLQFLGDLGPKAGLLEDQRRGERPHEFPPAGGGSGAFGLVGACWPGISMNGRSNLGGAGAWPGP